MVNYETFYGGGYSSLSPTYGNFVGYRLAGGELGQSINPATSNQLKETMNALKTGVQEVEVQMLGSFGNAPDVDQGIPKQHFAEMRGLLKLSGASASLHGPLLDPAGFSQQGADETQREENERRFLYAIERAHDLDPKGNIPVVFHSSNGSPGPTYAVDETKKPGEEGREFIQQDFMVNRETGEMRPLKRDVLFSPTDPEGLEKGRVFTTQDQLETANRSEWRRTMTSLAEYNKHAEEVFGDAPNYFSEVPNVYRTQQGFIDIETQQPVELTPQQIQKFNQLNKGNVFLENVQLQFTNAFQKAYEYARNDEQKQELKKLAETYRNDLEASNPYGGRAVSVVQPVITQQILQRAIDELDAITTKRRKDIEETSPELYTDAQKYALEKSSQTFSNVAAKAYAMYGEEMPIIAIENVFPGMAFHRAEDLKKLIQASRKEFEEQLVKKGVSATKAAKIANKHIGATWDVGHINLYKKYGFTDEELVAQTAKIAPDVRHLHLTDNFGFSDSHLVPGMGNVPIKQHLEKLERAGVLDRVRKVVEAGGYISQISQQGVHGESLSAFGSPIYGAKMASYWNQNMDIRGNYFGGYGTINPSQHHTSFYGAGFTTLPMELGGNIPGGTSRFSGNQMA